MKSHNASRRILGRQSVGSKANSRLPHKPKRTGPQPPQPSPPPRKTFFDGTRLPTRLFRDSPVTAVLGRSTFEQFLNPKVKFLLFKANLPQPAKLSTPFSLKMLSYVQLITTPTADTSGTCLFLHFDNKRYIFGNISEGTQRAIVQRSIAIQKVEDVFVSGLVNWHNAGGLPGLIITLADTMATKIASLKAKNEERAQNGKGKRPAEIATPKLGLHGGKNISYLLATARRFIFRKGLPLVPHEICDDPRSTEKGGSGPDWQDSNINVWYMPIQSDARSPVSPRKRTHEEFTQGSDVEAQSTSSNEYSPEDARRTLIDTVITSMFSSDWKMDALVETKLHDVKMPAKIFVREKGSQLEPYTGPLPGSGESVPNIPVLVRKPWPGALVPTLPKTEPSSQSMCYMVKSYERRGKFNPKVAQELGVDRRDYKLLTDGKNAVGKDGMVVTPAMVLGESVPGTGFALLDLPDVSYIDSLVSRKEWSDDRLMEGIHVIFWNLGNGVKDDSRLQGFMQRLSSVKHIVSSPDSCPNMISLESVATQAFKLHCIDPDRFPLPAYDNEVSLSNTPVTNTSSICELARTGKIVQLAPTILHQDNKIVPFPNLEKLARKNLSEEVLEMASQARAKISDPEFLAEVKKAESDIPHPDAEVIALGTGSAIPSKYRNVAGTLIRVPGIGNYLLDCGENTLGQLRRVFGNELPEVLRDLKCVWISHLHADHHLGMASVIKAWHEETRSSRPSAKLLVASHRHMIYWLEEYANVEDFGIDRLEMVSFKEMDPSRPSARIFKPRIFDRRERAEFGLARIDACFVTHCYGALATSLTFPTGLKVAYSGDCRPSYKDFTVIGQGATLLVHESTFDDERRLDAIAKKHSTTSEAVVVGRLMRARRIFLTHFSQRYQNIPLVGDSLVVRTDDDIAANASDKVLADEVVLVAFDYMRVRLGDFRKAQAFLPALQKLFQEDDVVDDGDVVAINNDVVDGGDVVAINDE
ncbi:hypothetical protein GGR52DRAFT_530257 [Hypoxylon sp. FL1284]|nr:hypothetical protein GGR52DRAFT_530257 [Hypoxylon sp. FL1284]